MARSRITLPRDLWSALTSGVGPWRRRPALVPEPAPAAPRRVGLHELRRSPHPLDFLARRFDYHVAGLGSLEGLPLPLVFAVNQQGPMDFTVLRSILPTRMRTRLQRPDRSLARGRSVVVYSGEPRAGGRVGEFSDEAAQLSLQHHVPIVPVGVVGTFNLRALLRLSLRTKPKVSIRFGAPLYARGRGVQETTDEVRAAVQELLSRGEVSWWASRRRGPETSSQCAPQPRWRRSWEIMTPRPARRGRVWPGSG